MQHRAEQLQRQVVQLVRGAGEHGGAHPLPLHRHPELAEHTPEGARHEVLVQHPELAALPAVAHLAQHRHRHLGDRGVDTGREQRLQQGVAHRGAVELGGPPPSRCGGWRRTRRRGSGAWGPLGAMERPARQRYDTRVAGPGHVTGAAGHTCWPIDLRVDAAALPAAGPAKRPVRDPVPRYSSFPRPSQKWARTACPSRAGGRAAPAGRSPRPAWPTMSSGPHCASPGGQGKQPWVDESGCRPGSVPCRRCRRRGDGHPSRVAVADHLQRPTRVLGRAALDRTLSGLAPDGVYRADLVTQVAGGLLHHRFTLAPAACVVRGGLFSVALSRGSPRVAVGHHPALRSPDLPRRWLPTDATVRPTRPPPV